MKSQYIPAATSHSSKHTCPSSAYILFPDNEIFTQTWCSPRISKSKLNLFRFWHFPSTNHKIACGDDIFNPQPNSRNWPVYETSSSPFIQENFFHPFLVQCACPSSFFFSTLSRMHDPILEETHGGPNLHKEPYGGNLKEGLKSLDEGSSKKGPHGQLFSLLSSFTILQQKLRCPKHPDKIYGSALVGEAQDSESRKLCSLKSIFENVPAEYQI